MLQLRKTYYFCFQYFPVLLVFAIILYEYAIFVILFLVKWFPLNEGMAVFVGIEFHLFFILLIISYLRTCCASPGFLPENINDFFANMNEIREKTIEMRKKQDHDKRIEYERRRNNRNNGDYIQTESKEKLESYQAINLGREFPSDVPHPQLDEITEVSFCFKCERVKIPRAHHCKTCNRCVLRMDHHCPWTGNCVGLNNHKFFVLFLFYACVCLLNIFLCMSGYVYYLLFDRSYHGEEFSTIINNLLCEIIALTFFVSIFFLLCYNLYSISKNLTTIEWNYERMTTNVYNLLVWPF